MTQQEVADQCRQLGLPRMDDSRVSKIERDALGLSPRVLPVMAQVLGLNVDEVLAAPPGNAGRRRAANGSGKSSTNGNGPASAA
jgi:hypothetical protein